jgi:hypothetical protein
MTFYVIPNHTASHKQHQKVTCTTCSLKKCVGRCHFESVSRPPSRKAA